MSVSENSRLALIDTSGTLELDFVGKCSITLFKADHRCPKCGAAGRRREGFFYNRQYACSDCRLTWQRSKTYALAEWGKP
jgi:predicted RNA-binding Zn-ribbon protein involved in translation (DUF1610 family)